MVEVHRTRNEALAALEDAEKRLLEESGELQIEQKREFIKRKLTLQ